MSETAGSSNEATPWWWKQLDAAGEPVGDEADAARFPTRGDAESWLGEAWSELAEEGVDAVVLLEGDRTVYGPMSLRAG